MTDGTTRRCDRCNQSGPHLCHPRADRAVRVFQELLCHTKGRWARKPFLLAPWQRGIVVPLFGEVHWDLEAERWIRRYRLCWIEVARKNGKSELLAAIAIILVVADDEESAEVFGAACDRDQARKVFDVAERMVLLSPVLNRRLTIKSAAKRIIDERTASYYEIIPADAGGALGHNPSGVIFDEVLTQKDGSLWDALRTGMGTRDQPLMVAATTAGSSSDSFAANQHAEMVKVAEDPARAPHILTYIRNTHPDADPWDETNWGHANPALGDFLRIQDLRNEALEARNDPSRENSFRQFRLNQWVQATTRFMPLDMWDRCAGEIAPTPDWPVAKLEGKRCVGGLDLSATTDMTAVCWLFPDETPWVALWRCWLPEAQIPLLDAYLGGKAAQWAREGWITVTEGNVVDYDAVYDGITQDAGRFKVTDVGHDRWMAEPVRQVLERRNLNLYPVGQGYAGMSTPMKEMMRRVRTKELIHYGNPVARWNASSLEARQDEAENLKPVKPQRERSGARIDLIVALLMAIDGAVRRAEPEYATYFA